MVGPLKFIPSRSWQSRNHEKHATMSRARFHKLVYLSSLYICASGVHPPLFSPAQQGSVRQRTYPDTPPPLTRPLCLRSPSPLVESCPTKLCLAENVSRHRPHPPSPSPVLPCPTHHSPLVHRQLIAPAGCASFCKVGSPVSGPCHSAACHICSSHGCRSARCSTST